MYYFYLTCFLAGATLMVCQFLMSLLGLGDHHDTDAGHDFHDAGGHDGHAGAHHGGHDHHASWFVGVLTFRTLVAAVTFFGLAGLAASQRNVDAPLSLAIALAAGAAALMLVAFLMRSLHRLKAEGTARIERAVGHVGTVYVPIPGQKAGVGKVTLNLQNRSVEYQAVTPHQQLPTGARVVVTAVVSPDTVEVAPATETIGSATHA
jgi:hypothetical protein